MIINKMGNNKLVTTNYYLFIYSVNILNLQYNLIQFAIENLLAILVIHSTSMTSSTIVAATMDMTVKIGITLPKSTIQKIDQRRGDIPRSRYIRRAVERYLGRSKDSTDNKVAASTKKSKRK
jgi:hypothetical protein